MENDPLKKKDSGYCAPDIQKFEKNFSTMYENSVKFQQSLKKSHKITDDELNIRFTL